MVMVGISKHATDEHQQQTGEVVGFRDTETGPIPADWKLVSVGSLFSFKNGLNKAKQFFGYGTPIINYMDVFSISGLRSGDIAGLVDVSRKEIDSFSCKKGDVFFTRTSETLDEIGVASVLLEDIENAVFSGFVLRARPINDDLVDDFKKYCFASKSVRQQIVSKGTYTTRALTNGRVLSSILLVVPPTKAEQQAIADSLNDADAQVEALEQLIEKKRAVKQSAMQQLLTGKTRLPGFVGAPSEVHAAPPGCNRTDIGGIGVVPEGWHIISLGDVCRIRTGKKDVNEGNHDGEYPFFTCSREHTYSDNYSFDTEAILVAGNGEVGNLQYFSGKFEAYQRTYVLSDFHTNVQFLWHQMNTHLRTSLGIGTIGSSIPYIKKGNMLSFKFASPLSPNEQTAIAKILSDMDAEIAALEQRRDTTRAIKQGMMQQLLTGKVRLV